jgi:hypothetical protein
VNWILLVPPGVEVDVRTSSAITEPILVTSDQVQAVALAAAEMLKAGLPVDAGALLSAMCRTRDPAQPELPGMGASLEPALQTAPEDRRTWICTCGAAFTAATGGEVALRRHQAGCATHAANFIPADRRVD